MEIENMSDTTNAPDLDDDLCDDMDPEPLNRYAYLDMGARARCAYTTSTVSPGRMTPTVLVRRLPVTP